jgi:hypothetical protein
MLSKTRIVLAAVATSAGFLVASAAPAVSQAQWHTICTAGHCTTHSNYTIGGVSPCSGVKSSYEKAYEGLLEALETKKELPDQVHPEMTAAEAQANVEEAEGKVHQAEVAGFEWGCDVAAMRHSSAKGAQAATKALQTAKAARA